MALFNSGMLEFRLVIDFSSVFVRLFKFPANLQSIAVPVIGWEGSQLFVQRAKNAQAPISPNKHACRNFSFFIKEKSFLKCNVKAKNMKRIENFLKRSKMTFKQRSTNANESWCGQNKMNGAQCLKIVVTQRAEDGSPNG